MKRSLIWLFAAGIAWWCSASAQAEQHRATHLGHPATRFAAPLVTPDDLRTRFLDQELKPDFVSVLRQWGWQGDVSDLFRAALTAEISDVKIPVGSTMLFMSSRKDGKAICLRNVLWAGKLPAPAYAFEFTSKGRLYRCVTPKACSNFFLEDLGVEPAPALAVECFAPRQVLAGRPIRVCLNLSNSGGSPEPNATVILVVPDGATVARATHGGVAEEGQVTWTVADLKPKARVELCAMIAAREPRSLSFTASVTGKKAPPAETACSTTVSGVPAILLELIDLEDPLEVGQLVTYQINVTNQGSAPGTNVRIVCKLPASQEFISGDGDTPIQATSGIITAGVLSTLPPKTVASWRVVVKAIQAADARFKVELSSDQFVLPIREEESTELY